MSLINNLKREIKNKKLYFIIISVCVLVYSLSIYFIMSSFEDKSVISIVSTLDGQSGMAGSAAFIYLYTPILFFGINSHIISSEKEGFIIKMKTRKNIFNNHVFFVIALSAIVSLLIVWLGYSIGWVYAGGFENLWPKRDRLYKLPQYKNLDILAILNTIPIYIVFLKTFIIKFLGLSMIGFLIIILKNIINNSGILAIVVLLVPFIDFEFLNSEILMNKFSLNLESWVSTSDFIINSAYLLFLLIALYLVGREMYKDKDFISKGY